MRVAHVVPTYPPYRGGVGRLAEEYATRLRARGHAIEVLTARCQPTPTDADFVRRLPAPLRAGNAAFLPSLVSRLRGFDLVHLHYPFFGGAEPVLLRKWFAPRQPLVLSYHMDAVASGVRGALFRVHARVVLPRLIASVDRVLVSSLDYASHSTLARIGDVLSRVEVHAYGVDTERFRPGREPALRERLGIRPEDAVALFVSRLDRAHHFKGLAVLLGALSAASHPRLRALIVGDGPLRAGFERLAASKGLSGRVYFAGDVGDADLPAWYRAADLHVCPSTAGAEAFSLVSLEAAASGVPTIASSLPGVRTVVVDGVSGVHVPPDDPAALQRALIALIDNPQHRMALGRAARERAEMHYRWDLAIERLERTYTDLLSPGR